MLRSHSLIEVGERLALQLRRLLARGRFGPIALILRDHRRIRVKEWDGIRVHRAEGTIEISTQDKVSEIPFEDLLAIELAPRVTPPKADK